MRKNHSIAFSGILTVAFYCFAPHFCQAAANITIYPTHIYLSPDEQTAVITLINRGSSEVNMQISAKSWDSDAKGQFVETDSGDFSFFPRLLTIPPLQEKKIRVGYQGEFPPLEKPYRIYINELAPIKRSDSQKKQFAIVSTLQLSVPLFVKPDTETHEAQPEIDGISQANNGISVQVRNLGVTNFLVRGIQLQWQDSVQKKLTSSGSTEAKRVLPHRFTQFALPALKVPCAKADKLLAQITVEGQKDPYQKEFKLQGKCVP
jgi:P pilus assembly chaperone PapD